ncbi:MAG: DUF1659 domain-containing protein [Bacteroides thetaiotaomicron]
MAITKENLSSKLSIRSNYGTVDGKDIIKSRTYSNLKATAADQDIYDTAVAISAIQDKPLQEVVRVETSILIEA